MLLEKSHLRKEESRQVEEDRRGEAERVNAIEDAGVSRNQRAVVFDAAVAFDGGHGHAAGEAHEADDERHAGGFPKLEGRRPVEEGACEGGGEESPEEAFPSAARANGGRDDMATCELAPSELKNIAELRDQDEVKQEARVASFEGDEHPGAFFGSILGNFPAA